MYRPEEAVRGVSGRKRLTHPDRGEGPWRCLASHPAAASEASPSLPETGRTVLLLHRIPSKPANPRRQRQAEIPVQRKGTGGSEQSPPSVPPRALHPSSEALKERQQPSIPFHFPALQQTENKGKEYEEAPPHSSAGRRDPPETLLHRQKSSGPRWELSKGPAPIAGLLSCITMEAKPYNQRAKGIDKSLEEIKFTDGSWAEHEISYAAVGGEVLEKLISSS
ncbi:hypothetical protein J5N97_022485 [Dioscorea zingiberensis]|uniref:Uncharacterized protein n=1 Tax=Dioscorea zingiberensis TaxID=325984 RepID=A0A9D5CBA7_9LILI|nr:hypothetical protein J5N97_022485 [Dioscorea zingiberensis]